jgi:hypothetical protein
MIRRGFWLAVGAAGGIMGYRRVTSIGRQLSASLSPTAVNGDAPRPAAANQRTADQRTADQRLADHRTDGRNGAALAGQAGRVGAVLTARASRGLLRGTIRFSRDARMFSRDVREGMDLYMVRHRAQGSPTLGAGVQSRRSPAPPPLIEAPGATTVTDERVKDDR